MQMVFFTNLMPILSLIEDTEDHKIQLQLVFFNLETTALITVKVSLPNCDVL